jgi:4-hydroxybenzoate polyprenyltransferase
MAEIIKEINSPENFSAQLEAERVKEIAKQNKDSSTSQATTEIGKIGFSAITGHLLKICWINFWWVIPILYIDFHFIMRYLLKSEAFCHFGEEWLPTQKISGLTSGSRSLETIEFIFFGFVNFYLLFVICLIAAFIGVIFYPLLKALEVIKNVIEIISDIARTFGSIGK